MRPSATLRIFSTGNLQPTQNPLDVAIEGDGFRRGAGGEEAYTRDGSFKLDADGDLVTTDGYLVMPGINIPPGARASSLLPTVPSAMNWPAMPLPVIRLLWLSSRTRLGCGPLAWLVSATGRPARWKTTLFPVRTAVAWLPAISNCLMCRWWKRW